MKNLPAGAKPSGQRLRFGAGSDPGSRNFPTRPAFYRAWSGRGRRSSRDLDGVGVETNALAKSPFAVAGGAFCRGSMMVKETKFFRKQADKAERMARSATDLEISQRYRNMARAYRTQADVLKAKKKAGKNSAKSQC
jgi:hypothetical protein